MRVKVNHNKMACWVVMLLIILLGVADSKSKSGISKVKLIWTNCGTSSDPIKVISLEITPQPISVPGLLTITADVKVERNLSSPIKASVTVKKKSFLGWMKVPCIDEMGSCDYGDLCTLSPFKSPCPKIFSKYNIPCTCPLQQGEYSVKNYTFPVKAVGPHWLEHGKYWARVLLSDGFHSLACYEYKFNLK